MVMSALFKPAEGALERRRQRVGVVIAVIYVVALMMPAIEIQTLGSPVGHWCFGVNCLIPLPSVTPLAGLPAVAWLANPLLILCVYRLLNGKMVHWSAPIAAFGLIFLSLTGPDSADDGVVIIARGFGWWLWAACPMVIFIFGLFDLKPLVRKDPPRKW